MEGSLFVFLGGLIGGFVGLWLHSRKSITSHEASDGEGGLQPERQMKELKFGRANLQLGLETVGGKLTLLEDRLEFKAHRLNIQQASETIQLKNIGNVEPGWTKFAGQFPLLPNAVRIESQDETYVFTVFRRSQWIRAIKQAIDRQ